MQNYAFILGRKNLLSTAELINVFESRTQIIEILPQALVAGFNDPLTRPQDSLNRLGGTIKIVEIFREVSLTEKNIDSIIVEHLISKCADSDTKLPYGLSVYNFPQKHEAILKKLLINIKKELKAAGIKSRFINKKFTNLKNAAIKGENLIGKGAEIVLIHGKHKIFIGWTEALQDFESYSHRDYDRPYRDPKLGMLPPKISQIMINLAGPADNKSPTLYDPFAGLGTILTEGLIMDYSVAGSDINGQIIDKAKKNIEWTVSEYRSEKEKIMPTYRVFQKDAASLTKKDLPEHIDLIVTESYLGPPLSKIPDEKQVKKTFHHIEETLFRFLGNIGKIIDSRTPIIICIPVYRDQNKYRYIESFPRIVNKAGFKIIPLIPHQIAAKFNLPIYKRESLIYDRPDQIVGREIWKLMRS